MSTAKSAAKGRSPRLNDLQNRALGTLYDTWVQDPTKQIILAQTFTAAAKTLVESGLAVQTSSDYGTTSQITEQGRRFYEEIEPKRAADSRQFWTEGESYDRLLAMLRALGYEAQLSVEAGTDRPEAFSITQSEKVLGLGKSEVENLVACPLKHPLTLAEYARGAARMSWFSFPQEV